MCGGIVSALTLSSPAKQSPRQLLPVLLGYNIGRMTGYVLAGIIIGGLGGVFIDLVDLQPIRQGMSIIAALFMIGLGLYLAGIWQGIAAIERGGKFLWKFIEPLGRRFIPVKSFSQALPLGFLWGWLPCALVYTVLIWTLTSASATEGGLMMLAFGLGTLPNLLAMGYLATTLTKWTHNPLVKKIAGGLVILFGIIMLYQGLAVSRFNY
jgi:sulfite exporter TauE/SafE